MYWNSKTQPLTPLPKSPLCLSIHDSDESILFSGFFYKRHPFFKSSYTTRLLIFTPTRLVWADGEDDQVVPKRSFRRSRINAVKLACGPKFLPGLSIQIDEKYFIFTHDDPLKIDKLTNFVVNYIGMAEDWPSFDCYIPQRPIIKIGVTVPGERTQYPEVAYRSNPVFTPSQIALCRGSRVFCQGLVYLNKQRCRMLITNELIQICDDTGDILLKCTPLEVQSILINQQPVAINSLEFNNQRDLQIDVSGEIFNIINDPQSQCQWNGALASFLGVLPSLDCIKNIEQYAENEDQYFQIFEDINRNDNIKQRVKNEKNEDSQSSDDDYVMFQGEGEDGISEEENEIVDVLIHDIVEDENVVTTSEQESANSSAMNKSLVEHIQKNTRMSFHASGARKSKTKQEKMQKMQNKLQKKEREYIKQVQEQIQQLNKEIDNQSTDSFEQSNTPELDIQELQDKAVKYSLQSLTKVLDHADYQDDPELNTWDLLVPFFEEYELEPDHLTLIDEAAQVRRKVLFEYAKQLSVNESDLSVTIGTIPEPFGDLLEFIDKIVISTPKTIDPSSLCIAFPASDVISERAKYVRHELLDQFNENCAMYGELIDFLKAFLNLEYDHRNDNQERYLLLPPEFIINLKLHKYIPTYLKYHPQPDVLTALQTYKIIFWYSENLGCTLAQSLRKLIAQETLLSVNNSSHCVRDAAIQFLQDGDMFDVNEAEQFIQELSSYSTQRKQQFFASLDAENSTFFGQNLHIFGANERVRRAGKIVVQALVGRLEARIIRQYFYFITGNIDIGFDFQEAEKFVSYCEGSYCEILCQPHKIHINQVCRGVIKEIYEGYVQMVKGLENRNVSQFVKFDLNGKKWERRGLFMRYENQFFKQRGCCVERVTGSRPDEELPARQFLFFFGQTCWICRILEGPKIALLCQLKIEREGDRFEISMKGKPLLICEMQEEVWKIDGETRAEIPASVNLLQLLFAFCYEKFTQEAVRDMNPTQFRLFTLDSPLDHQGAEYRVHADAEEEGLLTFCQELKARQIIRSADEIDACLEVFKDVDGLD
ncbi:hypothetical protein SS50377_26129 [Spironucleus salmonicida]|uniref:Uncharacterized protein n=1 Tax=Spironucleus salmonicida TaxID=348837 RepID=V6LP08_9EUKA|nr:hypothetical protein SS50377_26129 [Spironucleus salmonicida]|eukprot:EST46335.1 hypothetical protein SS50377_13646 [Spironucleus salmonicida]